VACGSADSSAFGGGSDNGDPNGTSSGGSSSSGGTQELIGDSSAPKTDAYRGSPLCRITETTCNPDDDGLNHYSATANTGVPCAVAPAPDAAPVADPMGCRLAGASDPICGAATPEHGDGAKCNNGTECAPGFDCVAADGMGVCRRYCCSGSCSENRSQNGGDTFCDVQKLQATGDKAPVCMPLKTCKLFVAGECAETETCAIVTESGGTGCVANGAARVGESCDTEHCNVGLTCLGQPGSRTCYQLCHTKDSSSCGPTQTCKTATIFNDPMIGVCK